MRVQYDEGIFWMWVAGICKWGCVNSSYKITYILKNIINSLTLLMLRMMLNIETYNVHKQISNYILDAFVSGHA